MEDLEFSEYDIIGQIDWNDFFDEFPEGIGAREMEPPSLGESTSPLGLSNSSPDSISSWINEIENALMNDDEEKEVSVPIDDCCDSFLADVLVDSHGGASVIDIDSNTSDCNNDFSNCQKEDEDKVSPAPAGDYCDSFMPEVLVDTHGRSSGVDAVVDVPSNASDCRDDSNNSQKEKVDAANIDDSVDEDAGDPVSKKRRRQLRNRDAAVRSRERKKMYVKDLEMKSKFLEGECRRLGRLLQCCCAENQALRFSLQMGGASGASLAKQESAVLLLESLLLGSLLWLVGTVCLFTLPQLPQSTLEPVPRVTVVEEEGPGSAPFNGGGNNNSRCSYSSLQTRRCKAARTRMKLSMLDAILA
ncbi:bZIP transcription factor 60 [Cucurbita maxima]|uniref:BZIP transcription factor 60 n=1 Tax=Cucurbita maxima TaxID=3661 RepID=A0A6J1IK91_CUCMA|nr:bZIP transcription factor 60 [Cucurbita maxima]